MLAASRLLSKLPRGARAPAVDLVMPVGESNRDWVFDRIAREVERHFAGTSRVAYLAPLLRPEDPALRRTPLWARLRSRRLPSARTCLVFGASSLHPPLLWNPHLWRARKVVLHTHADVPLVGPGGVLAQLRGADFVVGMNRASCDALVAAGWPADRIARVLCGSDPERFPAHARGGGAVGLCSGFQPRKAPERVLEVARGLPRHRFILLGRGWPGWERFGELAALPNFEYVEAPYAEYPDWYAKMDVFLSPSRNEGGPIPLLEAMQSNCVPVASRTGFAPDVVVHGENGFLFDVDAPAAEVCALVEEALALPGDVHASVAHLTWKRFVDELAGHLAP